MAESAKTKAAAAAKDETPEVKEEVEEVDDSLNGRIGRLWVEVNEGYEDDSLGLKATVLQSIEDLQFRLLGLADYKKSD
jgi:hypothetical protein